jgi:hypothetical protein
LDIPLHRLLVPLADRWANTDLRRCTCAEASQSDGVENRPERVFPDSMQRLADVSLSQRWLYVRGLRRSVEFGQFPLPELTRRRCSAICLTMPALS